MAFIIKREDLDFCLRSVREAEPYPFEEYMKMAAFDGDSHLGDMRYVSSICLQALLDLGYSEQEVNPWKKSN